MGIETLAPWTLEFRTGFFMIIAGIDPGSRVTGYGFLEVQGNRYRCVDFGAIRAGTSKQPLSYRLTKIYSELTTLMGSHHPSAVAVEGVFYATNAQSALKLGQARGVALLAAAQCGAQIVEYSPLEVKKAVAGYGRADKIQIQTMVGMLLNMVDPPRPNDAADALAVALCHAFRKPPAQHIQQR